MAAFVGKAIVALNIVFFLVLGYQFATILTAPGAYVSCFNYLDRWMLEIYTDFNIYVLLFGVWAAYKESSWIIGLIFGLSIDALGCLSTCPYILLQLYMMSPEEFSKNPVYYMLARRSKKDNTRHTGIPSVVTSRVICCALACLTMGVMIYTLVNDISTSFSRPFNQCIVPNLTDTFIHLVLLAVWIAYKEPSWSSVSWWSLFLLTFRSFATCVYVVKQLFDLSPEEPVSNILFNSRDRNLQTNDPLLTGHSNEVAAK